MPKNLELDNTTNFYEVPTPKNWDDIIILCLFIKKKQLLHYQFVELRLHVTYTGYFAFMTQMNFTFEIESFLYFKS
jgi:hypothetical protein